ncbi:hypothetical protein [Aeromicrobium sp. IC_218]|uniref:hypothetical protein n=1 Tax=Aeromicrobium sp. IC_218 TaxID=2545468 RepID=UPI00103BE38F|nr:hypothetical protein [Aeromicrobium sp. IC_218]TCI98838.1 hypothetical protein E0W78_08780 [Aeromicrobium sp. IC_218]
MDEREDVIEVRVMNEYGVDFPLWFDDEDGPDDPDEVELSPQLTQDLEAFAARWQAWDVPEVYEDRWDGVPIMQTLASWRWPLLRLLNPRRRSRDKAEAAAMHELGEQLARRVQDELGPRYAVTYWG